MRSLIAILVVVLIECCTQKVETPLPYSVDYCNNLQDDLTVNWGSNSTAEYYGCDTVKCVSKSHFMCMLGYTERPRWSEGFTWPSHGGDK